MDELMSYYRRRAAEETARAKATADATVAAIHHELARLYRLRATEPGDQTYAGSNPKVEA